MMKKQKTSEFIQLSRGLDKRRAPKRYFMATSDAIIANFKRTQNLTTIQSYFATSYDDFDSDRGAKPFRELISILLENVPSTDPKPRAVWLVSDSMELEHVICELRKHDHNLFDNLNAHASVALVDKASKYQKLLVDRAVLGSDSKQRQMLTAFPNRERNGYVYLAHFKPPAEEGWGKSSLCMALDDIPSQLDDLLQTLHSAHDERISGAEESRAEKLKELGISLMSLEDLVSERPEEIRI